MRSFTARDLIALPRLTAVEAFVLATELLTAADAQTKALKGKNLPAAIDRSRKRLATAHAALDVATRPQRGAADTQGKRKADRRIDNAWSATFDWLGGWGKLPEECNPDRADALALFELVFPGASLSFTKLPYKVEWGESQVRVNAILDGKHDKTFKRLGGEAFWAHIQQTHQEYGAALGITQVKETDPAAPDVRTVFLATLDALRDYANRVAAHADPDVPGSDALSEALLRPLVEWESRPIGGDTGSSEDGEETVGSTTPGEGASGEAPKDG
jgi:hypothetical protein